MTRDPAVAGQFYPGNKDSLLEELEEMIPQPGETIDAVGAVVPHAGYMYSGRVAGAVYSKLKPKDTYIILSPNHTGYGARFAFSCEKWSTPLGEVDIDEELISLMVKAAPIIEKDASAHAFEHSAEVQVPFIQKTSPGAKIVPLCVQAGSMEELENIAEAISGAVKKTERNAVIIASSDMTHYESRKSAKEKDKKAIEAVLELDARKLLETVEYNNITMCGCIPAAIMIIAAKRMGAERGELVDYSDSGDITGDTQQVVGYAGIIVH